MYPTKNYVTLRNVTQTCIATLLFIFCCQISYSQTNYLKLPKSNPQTINGQSNLVIENLAFTNLTGNNLSIFNSSNIIVRNCYFGVSMGIGVELENANNITIENCFFANNRSGVYATTCSGIKVNNNQFINAQGPFPRGQFVQFNGVTGAGNSVSGNRGECFRGESYAEDLINMFGTNGTAQSPVMVKDNIFRGGGPSPSGGGLMSGDLDGGNVVVENNVLVFPGNYGVAIAGGNNITLKNNSVYSDIKPWTNVGIYVWAQAGASCSNITLTGNKSTWTHKTGYNNPFWDGGNCGPLNWNGNNTTGQSLASMNFPAQVITCVTEDELWQVRDQSREFVVTVQRGEMPPWLSRPTANAGNDKTVNTTTTILTGSGGNSYRWVQVTGPNNATITNANSNNANVSGLVNGTYNFRLEVYDAEGSADADWIVVTVTNNQPTPNQPPVSDAGENITLTLPANTATLTGSGTDADGTIASYAWSRVSGPATFTLGTANAATTTLSNLLQGTYTFRLTVTDNSGAIDTDDMTVTVNAAPVVNQAPVANAGNNIVLTLPANSVSLTGSGTDADGTIASYAWSRVSGPATFTLGTANAATTTLSNLLQGTYTFRLTVTDNSGDSDTDDMTVTVNAAPVVNQAPVANAGNNIVLTLPANLTTLTGSGTDADGTIASYAWSRVSGPATFTLGTANAATTTLSNLLQGTYTFRLTVTDNSGDSDTDDMTVTVNAAPVVNQAPVANAGNNIVLTLPANSTTLTGSGTDADGTIASYAWSRVNGPATFTLGTANAATTTLSNLLQGTYTFRLTVTDNSGAIDTDDMTVTVNAAPVVNQAPVANAGNNIVLTLPANSTTLTGSGTDADGTIASYAWSRVSGPATFTLGTANAATTTLSNLLQGTYTFRLTVTDNSGAIDTDDMTVTVNAAPVVNQAPVANAGNNIVLTLPANSTTLTGIGTDADGTIASYAWSRVSGPATFALGTADAATTTLSNLLQGTYVFRLTVTDNSGATDTDDMTVTVNAAPVVNQAPVANAGNNIVLTLPANLTTLTGSGTDADGTIASYAWSRVSGPATFTLGTANAATTTLSNLLQGTYVFRLTVTDNSGATDTDDMTVTVNAAPVVNQAPLANAGNNIVLTLPANSTTLTGSGTDADGTIASYAWSRVSGPATFTLGTADAATTTLGNLLQGTYVFRLTVTDNSGATDTDDMTVTVNAAPVVNQAPLANAGNNIVLTLPANSTTLTGSGTDADGTIASYAWSRVSGPATFTLGTADAATTTLSNLLQGTYVFRLTVTDNSGATDTDDMTVTVNTAPVINQAPIANAGNNIVLTLPANSTTLTGSGTDADGTIASYAWSRVSGPATFTLGTANAATTTLSNLLQGTYVFRLTVTDNSGATDTDDMTVTVNAAPVINQAPIANAGNNIVLTLPANLTTLTGSGTDADGTIASYAWSRVSGPATFTLGTANAATTTLSNLLQGTYVFRLTVTDNSGATDTDDMTVTVNAAPVVNQAPLANAGVSQVATLSSNESTLNGTLSRDPDGTIKSYKWEQISGPAISAIAFVNLATTKVSGFREGDYIFQLTVTDNLNAIAKDTVAIAVLNNFRSFPGDLMLYPNPAIDIITFNLYNEKYSKAQITVYDMAGRKVLSTIEVNNTQARFTKIIDIKQLKAGVYLVEAIMDNKEKVTAKFIKLNN